MFRNILAKNIMRFFWVPNSRKMCSKTPEAKNTKVINKSSTEAVSKTEVSSDDLIPPNTKYTEDGNLTDEYRGFLKKKYPVTIDSKLLEEALERSAAVTQHSFCKFV
jgi:hypothetical protein